MSEGATPDETFHQGLWPAGEPITSQQVNDVKFDPSWRGYNELQVDGALDRLAAELDRRDKELEDVVKTWEAVVTAQNAALAEHDRTIAELRRRLGEDELR